MDISKIVEAIQSNRIRITDHADEEAQSDNLQYEEIFYSVLHGEIIEDYPKDKPYPSCLIFGETFASEPIHSVWAYNEKSKWSVLITVYRPDPSLWIEYKIRKKKS
jgi:Domain of unknown function (DUF4258)